MKNAKDVIREVICLFKGGERWTKGSFARDKAGDPTTVAEAEAATFCLVGGIRKVTLGTEWSDKRNQVYALVAACLPKKHQSIGNPADTVVHFNDSPSVTFDAVEAALAKALTRKLGKDGLPIVRKPRIKRGAVLLDCSCGNDRCLSPIDKLGQRKMVEVPA